MKDYLRGENLQLNRFTERYITAEYVSWINDQRINRYMFAGRIPLSIEKTRVPDFKNEMMFAVTTNLSAENKGPESVLVRGNSFDKYIGTTSVNSIDWVSRRCEIGYMIGNPDYWGAGLATELVGLLCDYCFNRLNFNKIEAGVVEGNTASVKVLEKNGFKKYGEMPEEYYLEGKYLSSHRFYRLQKW